MVKSWKFVALQLLALLLTAALALTAYAVTSQARAEAVAAREAGYQNFFRGIYTLCYSMYHEPEWCNYVAAEAVTYGVYETPSYSAGYAPVE